MSLNLAFHRTATELTGERRHRDIGDFGQA
jgi:hypothetical protein